jgi:glucokinase
MESQEVSCVRVIGCDAGGTKLLTGVVDSELFVYHRLRRLWPSDDGSAVLQSIIASIEDARRLAPDVAAVGLGIPSLVDSRTGNSMISVHLPLTGVDVGAAVARHTGLPVIVDNDANAAVLAEQRHGVASSHSHVVCLTIGTGIGGGLVLDGRLYRGSTGAGAELGHMVIDSNGPPCSGNCPNRGCLESLVSGRAIAAEAVSAAKRQPESALGRALGRGVQITGEAVTDFANSGDQTSREVLAVIGGRLGIGIANLINIFNPEVVVVAGGASAAGELLLEPARAVALERALAPGAEAVKIVSANFGVEAGMMGAAVMALDRASES